MHFTFRCLIAAEANQQLCYLSRQRHTHSFFLRQMHMLFTVPHYLVAFFRPGRSKTSAASCAEGIRACPLPSLMLSSGARMPSSQLTFYPSLSFPYDLCSHANLDSFHVVFWGVLRMFTGQSQYWMYASTAPRRFTRSGFVYITAPTEFETQQNLQNP